MLGGRDILRADAPDRSRSDRCAPPDRATSPAPPVRCRHPRGAWRCSRRGHPTSSGRSSPRYRSRAGPHHHVASDSSRAPSATCLRTVSRLSAALPSALTRPSTAISVSPPRSGAGPPRLAGSRRPGARGLRYAAADDRSRLPACPVGRMSPAPVSPSSRMGPGGRPMDYTQYQHLTFERKANGVVLITINRPDVLNATNDRLHWELTQVWLTLDADDGARVAVITGAGRAFSAGGDLEHGRGQRARSQARWPGPCAEASDLVYNIDQPRQAGDLGHQRRGGGRRAWSSPCWPTSASCRRPRASPTATPSSAWSAGDHAAILWPLLCGMAKAKYYLLTSRLHRRQGGRAHRPRQPLRAGRAAHAEGAGGGRQARPPAASRPSAGPSAALNNWLRHGRPDLRSVDRARDADLHGRGRPRGRAGHSREARAALFPSAMEPPR
mgnify:CR=1 FL=1